MKKKKEDEEDKSKNVKNELINLSNGSKSSFSLSKSQLVIKKTMKKWKRKIAKFIDSTPVVIIMSIFTVFALFATDIQSAFLGLQVDTAFNIIEIILLVLFLAELILSTIAKEGYLFSFFFWLDLISTASMIQDIDYIMNPILGYEPIKTETYSRGRRRASTAQAAKAIAKVSAASRATRVLRIIRIVRLIRMVKLYKNVLLEREKKNKKLQEEKKKLMEKLEMERLEKTEMSSSKTLVNSSSDDDAIFKNSLNGSNNNNNNGGSNLISENNNNHNYEVENGGNNNNGEVKSNNINGDFYENNGDSTRRPSKGGFVPNDNKDKDLGKTQTLKKLKLKKEEMERKLREKEKEEEARRKKFQKSKSKTLIAGNNDDEDENEELIKESKISKIVTESLTKKVIILILTLLLIFPLLSDDFYEDDSSIVYNLLTELLSTNYGIFTEKGIFDKSINLTNLYDPKYPPINITIRGLVYYQNPLYNKSNHTFRYKELKTVYSQDTQIRIVYSIRKETRLQGLLNLCQTIFVCICLTLASLTFEKDADDLVLDPLEIMIEIVEKVEKDPIGAKNIEELQEGVKAQVAQLEDQQENPNKKHDDTSENFEISVIKSAIIKISALLAIGFGEAGGEIIKKNLRQGEELNPRLMGKKKTAIFGFCDIRQFEEIALALEERTILFVNEIAEIVHSSVDKFQGATNKNIGESFLNVWKFYNVSKVHNHKDGEMKEIKKDNLLEIDPTNPQVGITADCSVLAFLRIILKINKNLNILAYRENENILKRIPNFKVNMGFGLHLGYGIEGAVGSSYKIDASYLSPNVNIAARLETATRQFGLSLLISGVLYDLFTDDMKNICRYIDCVTVKGSELPLDLYTIDLNLNVTPQKESKILIVSNKEKKNIFAEKKMQLEGVIEEYGAVTPIVLDKESYRELIKERSMDFNDSWKKGIESYKSGDWKMANMYFQTCSRIDPDDGPTKILLNYIRARKLVPPSDWKGVRELTSK